MEEEAIVATNDFDKLLEKIETERQTASNSELVIQMQMEILRAISSA